MAASGSSQLSAGVEGLRHVGRFSVGAPGDKDKECDITGIAECGVGFVVLDWKNVSVKLFDRDFTYLHHVKLEGGPEDICCEQDVVFVCVWDPAIVWKIKVVDKRLVEVVQWRVDSRWEYCRGVCVCQQGLAVCVYRVPGTAILLLDKETGETRREIVMEGDSGKLCAVDGGSTIAVAAWRGVLFVNVNTGKSTGVVCGRFGLYGITAGPGDSVIVADFYGGLLVVSARGAHVIKEGEKGRVAGHGVCYLPQTHRLVCQTYKGTDRVEIYQLLPEPVIPVEISRLDASAIRLYKEALAEGSVKDHDIRVMIVGHGGAGKTTLTKRLLKQPVTISERIPTEGIEVHAQRCRVKLNNDEWEVLKPDETSMVTSRRLAKLLKDRSALPNTQASLGQSELSDVPTASTSGKPETQSLSEEATHDVLQSGESHTHSVSPPGVDTRNDVPGDFHAPHPTDTMKPEEETQGEKIKKEIEQLMTEVQADPQDEASISIWDFAGQSLFYATHQVFLTPKAVYLLLTDMSKKLVDTIDDDNVFLDSRGRQECCVSDFLDFWIKSILQNCPQEGDVVPRFILVGTKLDEFLRTKTQEDVEEYFNEVYALPSVEKFVEHIADEEFGINNSVDNDPGMNGLMKKIVEIASKQTYWGQPRPAKWISLQKALSSLCINGTKVMKTSDIVDLGNSMPIPTSEAEIEVFLRYLHELGTVIFFNERGMNDHVLLEPQWLVDALKSIITFPKTRRRHLHDTDLLGKLKSFEKTAVIDRALIDAIWKETKTFTEHKDYLINLFVRLHLMAKISDNSAAAADVPTADARFLIPCQLTDFPSIATLPTTKPGFISTERLCINFPCHFFSVAIFNQLLAACASKWTIARQGDKMQIFCGCGIFEIDNTQRLTVYFRDEIAQLWVTALIEDTTPKMATCKEVLDLLSQTLKQDTELSVKCPKEPLESNKGMFTMQELKKESKIVCCDHEEPHNLKCDEMLRGWDNPFPSSTDTKTPSGLPPGQPSTSHGLLSDKVLGRVADQLGFEWHRVALELNVAQETLDQIQMVNPQNAHRQIVTALIKWRDDSSLGDNEKLEELIAALKYVNKPNVAEKLRQECSGQPTETGTEKVAAGQKRKLEQDEEETEQTKKMKTAENLPKE